MAINNRFENAVHECIAAYLAISSTDEQEEPLDGDEVCDLIQLFANVLKESQGDI